jgi:hypothetical protein
MYTSISDPRSPGLGQWIKDCYWGARERYGIRAINRLADASKLEMIEGVASTTRIGDGARVDAKASIFAKVVAALSRSKLVPKCISTSSSSGMAARSKSKITAYSIRSRYSQVQSFESLKSYYDGDVNGHNNCKLYI